MIKTKADKISLQETDEQQVAVKLYSKICEILDHGYDVEIKRVKGNMKITQVSRKANLEVLA